MPAALLLSLLAAASAVSAAAECRATPLGIPCFTVQYEHSVWALVRYPVRNFITTSLTGTLAVRADGAVTHRQQVASRYAARDKRDLAQATEFYYPVRFYDRNLHCRAGADAECRGPLPSYFGAGLQVERTGAGRSSGEPVVNYRLKNSMREFSVSLAPALDCQILRLEAVEYRYRYLPVRKELFEAQQVRRGEPAAALFQPAAAAAAAAKQ
ncbi:MAG: hypothetical protein FJW31_28865 [Acidobacteria bacterium]|nr:hypothetical protein [Acidobacteriota bacterium]